MSLVMPPLSVVKSIYTMGDSKCSSGVGVVLLGEIGAMLRLDHPCIVKMHEYYSIPLPLLLVLLRYFHGPSGIHIIMDRVGGSSMGSALWEHLIRYLALPSAWPWRQPRPVGLVLASMKLSR